jgi:sugar phosphate isomerase/epimerase
MPHTLGLRYSGLCSGGRLQRGDTEIRSLPLDVVAGTGVTGLELVLPPEATAEEVLNLIEPHGLSVASVETSTDLDDGHIGYTLETASTKAALAKALGATYLFTSVKAGHLPKRTAYERLRQVGDVVATHEIFLAMETHPDLCQNADNMLETMAGVSHPHVGINFDTANVYYYNRDTDGLAELKRVVQHVRGVHFKETNGGLKDGNFPVFGEGIVDFAGAEAVLEEAGYAGPYVMELEGSVFDYTKHDLLESQVRSCAEHIHRVCTIV